MPIRFILFFLCIGNGLCAQYSAPSGPLPAKIDSLERLLEVSHFPSPVHPVEDEREPGLYHWKHNTAVLCSSSDIQIEELGAYIFYGGKWNERVSMPPKDMDKLFGTKKGRMLKGQPYTFVDNWRSGRQINGGWAMWYFIGRDEGGKRVCGYQMLETTDQILK